MRCSIIVSMALATLGMAVSLPSCASSCVGTDFGGCGSLNVTCICSNEPLIANLACCVSTACDAADQQTTIEFADALCEGQGVTDLPKSATCAASASSTASGSSSGTAVVASTASSASSKASSASASAASSASNTASSDTTSTGTTSSASATSTATKNSGNRMDAGVAGIGALMVGAFAVL